MSGSKIVLLKIALMEPAHLELWNDVDCFSCFSSVWLYQALFSKRFRWRFCNLTSIKWSMTLLSIAANLCFPNNQRNCRSFGVKFYRNAQVETSWHTETTIVTISPVFCPGEMIGIIELVLKCGPLSMCCIVWNRSLSKHRTCIIEIEHKMKENYRLFSP